MPVLEDGHWRQLSCWLARMKALLCWAEVNRAFETLIVVPRRQQAFVAF